MKKLVQKVSTTKKKVMTTEKGCRFDEVGPLLCINMLRVFAHLQL